MVRVLHMIGSLNIGGSQTMVMNLYRNIDRDKIQFDFVIDHSDHLYFADEIKSLGGKIFVLPGFTGTNIYEIKSAWNTFWDEHREYKILHSHVRSYASIFIPVAKKHGVYTIMHSHSTSNGKGMRSFVKSIMQYPLRYQADYFMACSEVAGKWLFGSNVSKGKNYHVISNAIDSEIYNYNEKTRNEIRNELNIADKFVIGHMGRMTEPKNHEFLIKIFAEIIRKNIDAILLLVGDGDLRPEIQREVEQLKLKNQVIFLGNKKNTQDYYQAMDVFVFPSLWEGLGIVAIEAQASGLHCIVSERVPKEIDMKVGLVHVVSLESGCEKWADLIMKVKTKDRFGQSQAIKNAGYDVAKNAKIIQKFYLNVDEKMRK